MNYIGSKKKIINFVFSNINKHSNLNDLIFCDLFSGTGIVSKESKKYNPKKIISNDLQQYSYYLTEASLLKEDDIEFNFFKKIGLKSLEEIEYFLNNLNPKESYISKNFSPLSIKYSEYERMYFTIDNSKKMDAIRDFINTNISNFSKKEYSFLMASLLESLDLVSNVASVYGAYLKQFKKTALKKFVFKFIKLDKNSINYELFTDFAENTIKKIKGDVLYMDPPYNTRQYSSNYHILELISNKENLEVIGKTALPINNIKSKLSSKTNVLNSFEDIVKNADFKYIYLSYNSDGIMSEKQITDILKKYYKNVSLQKIEYKRFKADSSDSKNYNEDILYEFLFIASK